MKPTQIVAILFMASGLLFPSLMTAGEADETEAKQFILKPIGMIEKAGGKEQGAKGPATLVLSKDAAPGLLGLDGYSHVWVFYWFDQNDTPKWRGVRQLHPRGDKKNPMTGVFACRSPLRPNLIALTLCKIKSVKENRVEVERIDAFDKTPILDLKPYIPGYDTAEGATVPAWVKKMKPK